MIRTAIVDDEPKSRSLIRNILTQYCADVTIIGEAKNLPEAYALISKEEPDIVFLDIEMPSGTSFELFKLFPEVNFEIIFVTAYNQYAIKAIELNCLSYILKPVSIEKILTAIEKAKKTFRQKQIHHKIENLLSNYKQASISEHTRIALPTADGLQFVKIADIISLEADGSYTWVSCKQQKKKIISTKNLKEFEALLEGFSFFRVHRKYIINISFIIKYTKGEGGHVEMDDESIIPISKRRKNEFLNQLNRL